MRRSKLMRMLLLLLVVSMTLVACGGGSKDDGKTADGNVELRFLTWESNFRDVNQKAAEAYHEANPNVTVKFEYYGDQNSAEYDKKVDLMILGNEAIDITAASSYGKHAQRASAGTYIDLGPLFEKEGVKTDDVYNFSPKINGKQYGITGDWKSWLVLLNKDMLDEAGLPVPSLDWTWDDYAEYCRKLTKGEGAEKVYGSYFHNWDVYCQMSSYSVKLDNPFFKEDGVLNFDAPYIKDWLEFRNNLENVEKVSTPFEDVKAMNMNYRAQFFNGDMAMLPIGTWMISELADQSKFPHDFVTTFAPLPMWPDGGTAGRTFTESHYYSIPKTSKHVDEAFKFLRWYTTEGMRMRGVSIPNTKDVDRFEMFSGMIQDQKYVDMDALKAVLGNPKWEDNVSTIVPPYNQDIQSILLEECDKYLLGNQDVDTTIANIMDKGNAVIEANK